MDYVPDLMEKADLIMDKTMENKAKEPKEPKDSNKKNKIIKKIKIKPVENQSNSTNQSNDSLADDEDFINNELEE